MTIKPRYLKRRRHTWFFQIGIPAAVRSHFGGVVKIVKTTGCRDVADAQPIALRWAAEYQRRFRLARTSGSVGGAPREVYREKLAALEAGLFGVVIAPGGVEMDQDGIEHPYDHEGDAILVEIDALVAVLPVGKDGEPVLDARTQALLAALNDYRRPRKTERAEYAMAFSEAAERALESKRELTAHTVGQYRTMYRLFVDFVGDKALALVKKRDVAEYLDVLAKLDPRWGATAAARALHFSEIRARFTVAPGEAGLANKSLNKHLVALSLVWEWAKKREAVSGENPFKGQHQTVNSKTSKTYTHFDADDLQKLFAPGITWPRRDLEAVALVALYSGMRIAEITSLTWGDVKVENGVHYFDITASKTEAGVRKVPVHSKLSWLLGRRGKDPEALVFAPTIKSSHFTAHRRACGVEDETGRYRKAFHSFRKCVVRCLAGEPEDAIAQIVGHERPGFTSRVYNPQGLTMRQRQAVVEKITYPGLVVAPPA